MEREFPNLSVGESYRSDRYWCGEHAIGITTTPKETHEAFFLADLACDQLETLAADEDNQPFHLRIDFWGPHQPYFPTGEFAAMYDPEDIPVYGNFADTLEGKPDLYWNDPHRQLTDEDGRFVTPSQLDWGEWQRIIARAYAHITMVDAAGGLVLDKLEQLGLAENTLVIWTADHGDGLASHGGRFDKGSYLTEEVMRVPLAMRWPGQIPADQVSEALPVALISRRLFWMRPMRNSSSLSMVKACCLWRGVTIRPPDRHCWWKATVTDSARLSLPGPSSRTNTN